LRGGYYVDASGSHQAMVTTETNGVWGQPTELTLPTRATVTFQSAEINSVDCTDPGECVAVGDYNDANGLDDRQAMYANESNGVWGQATEMTLPAGSATVAGGQLASLESVSCSGAQDCAAVGSYRDSTGSLQAMTVSSIRSLVLSTPTLTEGVVDRPYVARLSVSGGTNTTSTWSIASGQLPPGIHLAGMGLNVGVISGTPTKTGTSEFTITANNPGPPSQNVSASFTLTVVPIPMGKPGTGTVKLKGTRLTVTTTCKGPSSEPCKGTVLLTTDEHLTKGKLVAVTAKATKPKRATKVVTLGKASYSTTGGHHQTVTIKLNTTGKRLLAKYSRLPAKLADIPTGGRLTAATKSITLKPRKAKAKRH
jgi:hypothetical protein